MRKLDNYWKSPVFSLPLFIIYFVSRLRAESSNWRVERVEKVNMFFKLCRIKTQNVVLFLLATLVSHSFFFLFFSALDWVNLSVLMLVLKQVKTVSSLLSTNFFSLFSLFASFQYLSRVPCRLMMTT